MEILSHPIEYLLLSIIAGFLGSLAMAGYMHLVDRNIEQSMNMLTILGRFFEGETEKAKNYAVRIYLVVGTDFGFAYTAIIAESGLHEFWQIVMASMGMGVFHGIVVSYSLMYILISDSKHPDKDTEMAPLQVGLWYTSGHMLYGIVVGLIISASPNLVSS